MIIMKISFNWLENEYEEMFWCNFMHIKKIDEEIKKKIENFSLVLTGSLKILRSCLRFQQSL